MPRPPALIKICEEAFKQYNAGELNQSNQGRHRHYRSIARTFDKVGQNPWNDNLSEFERHLSELSEDSMYKALIMASQQAQELDPETTVHEK